ncbi:MAG: ribonuclease Z [Alistipes sp.]|nr:ribonuclease Z [Alistipes sp.]MBR2115756.1 ribonuclease Z [Alistipes sp.]
MMIKVTVLGRASAKPTVTSHPSAQIVNVNEQYYLVDAGEGTQQQMFRRGINPLKLRAVFISHLHGDHVFGLFPLLSTMGLCGRQMPLKVFAPRPFDEMLEFHLKYFDEHLPYQVEWVEVDTTKHCCIFENKSVEVWSVPLRHKIPCAGFHFKERSPELNVHKFKIEKYSLSIAQIVAAKRGEDITLEDGTVIENSELTYLPFTPKSYAYLSDTSRSAVAARRIKGVDLLYHEATYTKEFARDAKERGHSTAADAAQIAVAAEAKALIIGHFSSRYKSPEALLAEAKEIFENTQLAEEGETYTL